MSATSTATASSSSQPAPARLRRRWYQFSLKTLTIFMVLSSVLFGVLGWRLQRARKQAETVKALRSLGCNVQYDYDFEPIGDGGFTWAQTKGSKLPTFLVQWLGEDFFHHVHAMNANRVQPKSPQEVQEFWKAAATLKRLRHFQLQGEWLDHDGFASLRGHPTLQHVLLSSKHVTDADLVVAGTMPELREFWLTGFGMNVTDDGVAGLNELRELRSFHLYQACITDNAAKHLANHPKLISLQLGLNPSLTDESTVWLAKLTELRQLSVNGVGIGDQGLKNLKALKKLNSLSIGNTQISDKGMAHLAELTDLQMVDVQGTKFHGPGLAHLRNLSKLETLSCLGNPITDDDLHFFADMPALQRLQLGESKVTDEGIMRLKVSPLVTEIHLPSTAITDMSLDALATNSQLTMLWVSNTKVTPAGIARFKKRLPTCNLIP